METALLQNTPHTISVADDVPKQAVSQEVPQWLLGTIQIALRAQEKVEDALAAGHRPGFLRTYTMLNCRKSVAVVQGVTTIKDAVQNTSDINGVETLVSDTMRIQEQGAVPVMGTLGALHIDEYLDEHSQDLPAIVHVFSAHNTQVGKIVESLFSGAIISEKIVRSLGRIHSFIVLEKNAKGEYVCFHKQGPDIGHKLEIVTLDQVMRSLVAEGDNERISVSFVGKIQNPDQ